MYSTRSSPVSPAGTIGLKGASSSAPTEAFAEIRTKVLQRFGKVGLKSVGQLLRSMDTNDNGYLEADELRMGLRDGLGVCISDGDFEKIVKALDVNGDGKIDLREMVVGLRGNVPNRRRNVVEQAFKRLDIGGTGFITVDEFERAYDCSRHPDVLARRATPEQVTAKFMASFNKDGHSNGLVSAEEFANYYVGVSAEIPQDDQFELLLIRTWSLDRPNNATLALAASRSSASGQDGVSSRYNANHGVAPPPKNGGLNGTNGFNASGSAAGAKGFNNSRGYVAEDGAIARHEHPLYQTSMQEYGRKANEHTHNPMHHRPGGFTKNAPPFSAGSGLNTATTRSKVI